jgi:hypothetical protein
MPTTKTNPEHRLLELFDALWDDFVDPREAYADDGEWWLPVGSTGATGSAGATGPMNESQLRELRRQCRRLAHTNEFAINGHENRISYLVGAGHNYRATVCKGMDGSPDVALAVQKVLDRFLEENRWHERQQEIVRRMDRDGEAFLQFFVDREGLTRVRFIEPDQVAEPADRVQGSGFGVQPDPLNPEPRTLNPYGDSSFGLRRCEKICGEPRSCSAI